MTASPRRPTPKPWPMKWIVAAIAVFVIGYTVVNVLYRKPGQAYRPYQDAQDRATTSRLLAAGWHKLPVDYRRPVEPVAFDGPATAVTPGAVGLGLDFDPNFAEKPRLTASVDRVTAPARIRQGQDYRLDFTVTLPSAKVQVGDVLLFQHGTDLVLLASTEPLPGEALMNRWTDSNYTASFPTADLPPGRYRLRLVAHGPCATLSFTVE